MITRLQAEEDLRLVNVLWIASQSNHDKEANAKRKALEELQEQAWGESDRPKRKPPPLPILAHQLQAMGIGFEVVTPEQLEPKAENVKTYQ